MRKISFLPESIYITTNEPFKIKTGVKKIKWLDKNTAEVWPMSETITDTYLVPWQNHPTTYIIYTNQKTIQVYENIEEGEFIINII